jgi:uncharacterized membrane protein YfcA
MEPNVDTGILGLWQQQSREERLMPLDDIRTKAERLDAKTRRWRVITAVLFVLLLMKGALEVWTQEGMLERAGDLLLLVALVYIAYRYRKQRLAAPPVALGRTNCADFYRAELVRQRDLSKDGWGFLLPFVPGMALALLDGRLEARSTSQLIAAVASGVGLFLGIAWWNAHTARRLHNDIDALDAP